MIKTLGGFYRMKKILVTGALGQIGTELVMRLRKDYGMDNVIATNIRRKESPVLEEGIYEDLDVVDYQRIYDLVKQYEVDTVIHLAAMLSATGEANPQALWNVNMNGLYNVLEVARETGISVFTPSSIAAFGPNTPKVNTPQDTIQRPTTIYGVSKVAGELLCDYYYKKFNVDTRGVRYPGLISNGALPGGGTTDYAVHIYYEAIKSGHYTSYIAKGTKMDMMYMPDAIDAIIQLCEADGSKLIHRNAFNITAMSFDPEELKESIQKFMPNFTMDYQVDECRQLIANSWPDSLDDSAARTEWDWDPKYDLDSMTEDMLKTLSEKIK
jgi:nucleoside-diphosphate-sugar epimerase